MMAKMKPVPPLPLRSLPLPRESTAFWALSLYALCTLGSMAMMSIGAAVVTLLLILSSNAPGAFGTELLQTARHPRVRRYVQACLALLVACAISLIGARWAPLVFNGKSAAVHLPADLAKAWYFPFSIVLLTAWRRLGPRYELSGVFRVWLIGFGLISLIGIIQFFTGWPRAQPNPLLPGYFHSTLLYGHHLSTANILIFPFFICLDFLAHPLRSLRLPRAALAIFALFGFLTLFMTWSRTLWVALPLGLLIWIFLQMPRRAWLPLIAATLLGAYLIYLTPFVQTRVHHSLGVGERIELWRDNWEFFKMRPVFGVGLGKNIDIAGIYLEAKYPGREVFVGHAHNIYLEVIAGLGVFGLIAWLFWLATAIEGAWLRLREPADTQSPDFARGILCAWVVFLINGLTQVNFWEGKVMHQLMWITSLTLYLAVTRGDRASSH